jgi:hypothetical protein
VEVLNNLIEVIAEVERHKPTADTTKEVEFHLFKTVLWVVVLE